MNNWRQILSWKPIDDGQPHVGEIWSAEHFSSYDWLIVDVSDDIISNKAIRYHDNRDPLDSSKIFQDDRTYFMRNYTKCKD